MKTKSNASKKNTMLVLSALMAVTACSKTVTETKYVPVSQAPGSASSLNSSRSDIDSLRMLLKSKSPNLALAELLSKSVAREHQAEIKQMFAELSPDEARAIIEKVDKDNQSIRKNYLYRGQVYKDNPQLIKSSLLNPELFHDQQFSFETQIRNTAFAYMKSKALDEIISTYDKRANELAIELANDIAIDIGESYPSVAKQIETGMNSSSKEEVIQMIQKAKPVAEKIDQYFRSSKLSEGDQYVVAISGIIAGSVYMQVKDKESFKRIVREGKRIARDINEFKTKANEFIYLVNTLEGHIERTGKDFKELGEGMSGARKDLLDMAKQIRPGAADISSRRIVDFLHGSLLGGKKPSANGTNESILSKQRSFGENFDKSLKAAGNLTNNLSAIIQTTQAMSKLLGIKPSKDLANVLDKAQKVSAVISTVQSAVAGFASGGFIGAIGAIGSGPLMSMMGGGRSADSAKLDEISRKLDMVLKNQQIIMKMQVETMNMIKELALMVDTYHQQEMIALAELRDYSLVNLEMQKATINKDIRSCESMIEYQLNSVWKSFDFSTGSIYNINNIAFINEKFTSSISGLQDIRRIMTSVEEDGFKKCQAGIAEAFGGNNSEENPIRAIFASDENKNLFKFQREVYSPLLTSLEYIADTSDFDSLPLHVPSATYDSLQFKRPYINNAGLAERSNDNYDMTHLVSVKNLERYLSHLIVLHPLLDLDKPVWQKSYEEIVNTYIENSNTENNQNTRSHYFLNNALKMVQSAIAQEALLAGEPILEKLQDAYIDDIFSAQQCDAIKRQDVPEPEAISFFCALRNNKLLMKNVLQLHLSKKVNNVSFMDNYRAAIDAGNKAEIAKLLDMGMSAERIEVAKNRDGNGNDVFVIVMNASKEKVSVKLPSLESLKEGQILYSENMSRLLKMQNLILNGLEKVAPVKRDHKDKDLLKLLLVSM